mmetsp:Transcript_50089/g.92427  ORF Transcript_50089/g.92427 Transcript_50089/m.92427 type:complete len:269 (+) Transcript_50089:198-1004(+)
MAAVVAAASAARRRFRGVTASLSSWTRRSVTCPSFILAATVFDHVFFLVVFLLPYGFDGEAELSMKRMLFWTLPVSLASCSLRSMERGPGLHWMLVGPVCILHLFHSALYLFARIATGVSQSVLIDMAAGSMLGFVIGVDMLIFLGAYVPEGRGVQDLVPASFRSQPSSVPSPVKKPAMEVLRCQTEAELAKLTPGSTCTMCLEELKVDESLGRLTCGHVFHEACLSEWMQHKFRAPFCPYRCSAQICLPVRQVPSGLSGSERPEELV